MGIKYGRGRGGARISLSRGSVLSREYFPSSSYINSLSVILPASLGNSSKTTKKVKTRIPRCDHAEVPGGKKINGFSPIQRRGRREQQRQAVADSLMSTAT